VDSRILKHDDIVQKQSFDQTYKNFWSFIDFNTNYFNESLNNQQVFTKSNLNYSGNLKQTTNVQNTGFQNTFSKSQNYPQTTLTYTEARKRADQLLRNNK
jgi:hypothetical protein